MDNEESRVGAAAWWQATKAQSVQIAPFTGGDIGVIDTSVMTVALLRRCSAATARPKAIRSTTKMSMRTSLDARRIDARLQEAEAEMLAQSDSGRSAVAESSHRRKKSSNLKQGESAMNGDHEERREEVVFRSRGRGGGWCGGCVGGGGLEGRNSVGSSTETPRMLRLNAKQLRSTPLAEEEDAWKTDNGRLAEMRDCRRRTGKDVVAANDSERNRRRRVFGGSWTDALQPSKWANSSTGVTTSDRRAYEVGQRSPLGALHQGNLQCGRDQRAIAVLCRMGDGFRDIRGERYVGLKSADQISIYGGKIEKGGVGSDERKLDKTDKSDSGEERQWRDS
ncbi:hypothetical protein MUK42_30760 [Musa troglodytarum]|uniref:Uncharacterized protein n=1 Tax=Musa troglodytarum TaxID=320322 RepID=A0A9E7EF98_9LILI|nr:hypothetical protein MUK42_30760 [Musa troglodytarum]